jgi:hypothetical protein
VFSDSVWSVMRGAVRGPTPHPHARPRARQRSVTTHFVNLGRSHLTLIDNTLISNALCCNPGMLCSEWPTLRPASLSVLRVARAILGTRHTDRLESETQRPEPRAATRVATLMEMGA